MPFFFVHFMRKLNYSSSIFQFASLHPTHCSWIACTSWAPSFYFTMCKDSGVEMKMKKFIFKLRVRSFTFRPEEQLPLSFFYFYSFFFSRKERLSYSITYSKRTPSAWALRKFPESSRFSFSADSGHSCEKFLIRNSYWGKWVFRKDSKYLLEFSNWS